MKKKLIALVIFLLAVAGYFVFFHKDKTLEYIPENADVVVLLDTKNFVRQYISSLATHPSQWFGSKNKKEKIISIQESGMKIPDFLQIFHIKNSKLSDWYSVVELKNREQFLTFLKSQKFINKGKNLFQKSQVFIKIEANHAVFGTSNLAFKDINEYLFSAERKNIFNADQFIDNSLGSVSFISTHKIQNFSIELNDNTIDMKNNSNPEIFSSVLTKLEKKKAFLEFELNLKNIRNITSFWDKSFADSSQINYVKTNAELELVNDTIITYGYDDNFNEVEKKSFQKIVQPNYSIDIQSLNLQKTEQYFQNKKWMNAQNQFTAIPFQPNVIEKNKKGFQIKSTRKSVLLSPKLNENYIFVRNNPLLFSSVKTLSAAEKKLISDIEYIFYGNKDQDYYLKLQCKKGQLPLIFRW